MVVGFPGALLNSSRHNSARRCISEIFLGTVLNSSQIITVYHIDEWQVKPIEMNFLNSKIALQMLSASQVLHVPAIGFTARTGPEKNQV